MDTLLIDASLLQQMLIGALLGLSVYLPLRCGQLSLATPGFYAIGGAPGGAGRPPGGGGGGGAGTASRRAFFR